MKILFQRCIFRQKRTD